MTNRITKDNEIYLDDLYSNDEIAIPDLDNLTNNIVQILEYINRDDMQKLENRDKEKFDMELNNKFNEFSLNYIGIFNLLLDKNNRKDNILRLMKMIETLKQVKYGIKDYDTEFDNFKEELANNYLYPKFGGKKGFERKMKQKQIKNRKNKK